ncbi:MAG TPA: 50S ribosomal protein L24 [Candidatus Cybelea sp.]|jgi:large subunit ribosomal protein L24|nr:50S ribosomal protein L24 [Candidatus Cybelea sp.]
MATKANIIKGDTVMVRRGKERGKRGTVRAVHGSSATVEGINVVKRHTKAGTKSSNVGSSTQTGGIVEKEAPLPVSALQYVCEKCKAPARLSHRRSAEGVAQRVCARCGEPARESAKGA